MFIVKHKKIFIAVSAALVAISLILILTLGIKIGIDFKGGALIEVTYKTTRPDQSLLNPALESLNLGSVLLQPTGDLGYIVKTRDLTEEEHSKLLEALTMPVLVDDTGQNDLTETSYNSIGPSVGKELTRKAVLSILLVSIAIVAYIAFAFRKVSEPVASWKYGVIAIVTLLHDVIVPVGLFTFLSKFLGAEIDTLFVVAILTILGLSVSDTIVIFDRIRENLKEEVPGKRQTFAETVGKSLDQSYVRSIATSLTVILVLLALFFWGPVTTKYFALMLMAGMFMGTYSSICLASPLLVWLEEKGKK